MHTHVTAKQSRSNRFASNFQHKKILTAPPITGKEVDHGFAKELVAGFAGAEVDRFAETDGADWVDKERAKRDAQDKAKDLYDQQYGQEENFDPERHRPHRRMQESFQDNNW